MNRRELVKGLGWSAAGSALFTTQAEAITHQRYLTLLGRAGTTVTPRTLFWVGGTGNWSDSAHWALTSGGAGGNAAPVSVDTVTFDGSSGGGTVTIDVATANAASVTFGSFTSGTIVASAKTLNFGSVTGSGTATRGFNITNSTVNVTTGSWNFSTVTGLTFTSTGSTINIQGNGNRTVNFGALSYGTVNATGSGFVTCGNQSVTFVNLTRTGSASLSDGFIVGTFTITGTFTVSGNSQTNRMQLSSASIGAQRTVTCSNPPVLTNVDITNITAAGAGGTWTGTSLGDGQGCSNITFTVAVNRYWVGGSGNYSDTTHWSASSGGAGGATMPLLQDAAIFDANSFSAASQVCTIDVTKIGNQDWSAVTNLPTLQRTANTGVYGNYDVPYGPFGSPGVIDAGLFTTTFVAMGGNTANVNLHLAAVSVPGGQTVLSEGFASNVVINAPGGTIKLLSHFLVKALMTLQAGTYSLNGFNTQFTNFASTGTTTRAITGTGVGEQLIASSNSGSGVPIHNFTATGITITGNIQICTFSGSSAVRVLNLAGLTFGSFLHWWHDGLNNSPTVQINGGATFSGAFTVDTQQAAPPAQSSPVSFTYTFASGATVTAGSFTINGYDAGSRVTVNASASGSQATLSDASGTNAFTFLTLKDIACTGGATWTATSSVNNGNNTGIAIS